ncbi:uncharacterized protein LOC123508841 isoform X1 [Portunus trituberculatus]|uniref:Uncharacterized protein n=1 Tax=Portunus trituberculatus TaxID=210409 RepID=A0A5B7D2T2_PORTR|nr:uncharacterized protein LOC123508841 isoform X1 [Portunus trituberculatus]MPC15798.1 hypothetical protein [Portunus trituberculatus]
MSRLALGCLLAACLAVATAEQELDSIQDLETDDGNIYDDEGRLLIVTVGSGTSATSLNFTNLLPSLFSSIGPFLAGAGLTALGFGIPSAILWGKGCYGYGYGSGSGSGYGSDSGYGNSGGYSSYSSYRRSFDPYAIDWEKFSIIDWIAIGEEAWRKFDPADLECQKRLICEIHQNTSRFGAPAARIVDVFSYLQYAEVLSLPDEIKALVEEYNDAADRGRNLQKDCGDVYTTCDFSVKKIMEKYSHNEI